MEIVQIQKRMYKETCKKCGFSSIGATEKQAERYLKLHNCGKEKLKREQKK